MIEATKDLDGDGTISESELKAWDEHARLHTQSKIAVAAFVFMVVLTIALCVPAVIPGHRVLALSALISTMYVSMAGIVMAYFGASAWAGKKK